MAGEPADAVPYGLVWLAQVLAVAGHRTPPTA
jgi:hypothetical protein